MKILYCVPSMYNPGGMERILTEKMNYLADNLGYQITLVTTDQLNKPFFFKLSDKVKVYHLNLNFNLDFKKGIFKKYIHIRKKLRIYKRQLENIIKNSDIEICISTGGKELEFLSYLNSDCKKIFEAHFAKNFRKQFLVARNNNFKNRIIGSIRTKQLIYQTQKLDAVVVLTKKDLKEWKSTNKNVHQIYNFSSISGAKRIDGFNKRAIAIGKLDAQKGFDMLIKSWALAKNDLKDWELHIFGQGEWETLLNQEIEKNDLKNNIFLNGVTKDIENELLKSSLFLFSSRYEGFSLVFIEAMNCGLPIVSFDCPEGPGELIINDDIGVLVEANNVEKFSEAIVNLIKNDNVRVQKGINSYLKGKQFCKENIMMEWHQFFSNLS